MQVRWHIQLRLYLPAERSEFAGVVFRFDTDRVLGKTGTPAYWAPLVVQFLNVEGCGELAPFRLVTELLRPLLPVPTMDVRWR